MPWLSVSSSRSSFTGHPGATCRQFQLRGHHQTFGIVAPRPTPQRGAPFQCGPRYLQQSIWHQLQVSQTYGGAGCDLNGDRWFSGTAHLSAEIHCRSVPQSTGDGNRVDPWPRLTNIAKHNRKPPAPRLTLIQNGARLARVIVSDQQTRIQFVSCMRIIEPSEAMTSADLIPEI